MDTEESRMEEPGITRRVFERATLMGMGLVYGAGFVGAALRYLLSPPGGRRLSRLDVGPREKFLGGEVGSVVFNGHKIYVLAEGGRIRAIDAQCTHLSCNVNWVGADRKFKCPCHGGLFGAGGELLHDPPTLPLRHQPFEVTPKGRVVLLDRKEPA
jgi:cytochrome b6-f complex iron-sulfur subunit